MFHDHPLWKTRKGAPQASLVSQGPADTAPHRHLRRRPWIYGVGALLPLLISLLTLTPAFATTVTQWSGWFPPASTPLATVSTPAAVEYNTGKTDPGCTFICTPILVRYLFARQSNDTIDFSTSTIDGGSQTAWTQLSPVPGGGLTPNAPTAAQLGSKLYLFVQGLDNVVWVNTFDGANWSGWSQLKTIPQNLVPTQNSPYVTAYQGVLFLFVRNPVDGTIDVTITDDGITWAQLKPVPGGGHTPNTPTAAVFGNTLYAMVQGPDNFVWVNTFDGVNWSGWSRPQDSSGNFIPTSTSPIAGPDGNGSFHLIVRRSADGTFAEGSIAESVTSDGTHWSVPSEVPHNGRTPSALAVMQMSSVDSELFLFAQGLDNNIYENVFEVIPG